MIKINLLKNKVNAGTPVEGNISFEAGSSDKDAKIQAAVKILAMLIFALGIKFYRGMQIDELNVESRRVNAEVAQLQKEVAAKKAKAGTKIKVESEAKQMQDKLEILKNLSKIRLREVKALDYIQSNMPEKVWLTTIRYENARFEVLGRALSEEDVNEFIRSLENGPYFKDVILLQSTDDRSGTGTMKSFEISFNVENQS